MRELIQGALQDMAAGLRARSVWTALAAEDIDDAHRRTFLGPIWLLLNYLLFVGTFAVVFGRNFGIDDYSAYVALGLLVWLFVSETISQSVALFVREENFIKGTVLPFSVYVLRQCMQSTIRAGYALIGAIAVLLLTGIYPSWPWLWSAAGVLFVLLTAPAAVTVLAFAGAMLPDLQFVVANLVRLGMFLTPIFWSHEGQGGVRAAFYHLNPFTYYLAIVRAPILGGEAPVTAWGLCVAMTALLWIIAIPLLGRYRRQLALLS